MEGAKNPSFAIFGTDADKCGWKWTMAAWIPSWSGRAIGWIEWMTKSQGCSDDSATW